MDEMIHISHQSKVLGTTQQFNGIRPIVIKDVYDIDRQIDRVRSSVHPFTLRANAPVFISSVAQPAGAMHSITKDSPLDGVTTDSLAREHMDDRQEEENEGGYEESDDEEIPVDPEIEASAYPNDPSLMQKHDRPLSEKEVSAAKFVLLAYRQYRFRRSGHFRTGFLGARDQLFIDCWEVVRKYEWRCGYYRLLFLGPLPHLLLCLQEVLSVLHADKVQKRKLIRKVKHQELENVMGQMDEVT